MCDFVDSSSKYIFSTILDASDRAASKVDQDLSGPQKTHLLFHVCVGVCIAHKYKRRILEMDVHRERVEDTVKNKQINKKFEGKGYKLN